MLVVADTHSVEAVKGWIELKTNSINHKHYLIKTSFAEYSQHVHPQRSYVGTGYAASSSIPCEAQGPAVVAAILLQRPFFTRRRFFVKCESWDCVATDG